MVKYDQQKSTNTYILVRRKYSILGNFETTRTVVGWIGPQTGQTRTQSLLLPLLFQMSTTGQTRTQMITYSAHNYQ